MSSLVFPVDPAVAAATFRARGERRFAEREERRRAALEAVGKAVRAVLSFHPRQSRGYLFGSVVRPGAFGSASDVDVAIESASAEEYFAIWRELETAAPDWTVDLRVLADSSQFAEGVRSHGTIVYERLSSDS